MRLECRYLLHTPSASADLLSDGTYLVLCDSGLVTNDDLHIYHGDGTVGSWQDISAGRSYFLNLLTDGESNIYAIYPGHLAKTTDRGASWDTIFTATDEFLDYTHIIDINSNGDLFR